MSGSRRKPGPLRPFVDRYRAWLVERGYSPFGGVVRSLGTLGHLGRWLERNALAVDQLRHPAPQHRDPPSSHQRLDMPVTDGAVKASRGSLPFGTETQLSA